MYVDSLACVRIKGGESEQFRIDSRVRLLHHVPLAFQCICACNDERRENGDGMKRSKIDGGG